MTDETMSTLTVTPSMSSQISFERFPLKGVLGVKGVLAWAHRRARALKELQIEAFYARARHPFLGGGPYVTYIFWGGWGRGGAENVTYNRRPPKRYQKYLVSANRSNMLSANGRSGNIQLERGTFDWCSQIEHRCSWIGQWNVISHFL